MAERRKKNTVIVEDLEITDAGSEGKAVGRWNDKVVFVRHAVPGDIADVEIYRRKNKYCEAWISRIKKESPWRVEPRCSHSGLCGGCKWQNMDYTRQLYFKQKQVEDNLLRIGHLAIDEVRPILASDMIFGYRNKMEYTFSVLRWFTNEEMKSDERDSKALGFHLPGQFDRVLDIDNCHLQDDIANKIRNEVKRFCIENGYEFYNAKNHTGHLRNLVLRNTISGDWMVILVFAYADKDKNKALLEFVRQQYPEVISIYYVINDKKNDIISDMEIVRWYGQDSLVENMGDLKFRIGPVSFFQTNPRQACRLYNAVREMAGIHKDDVVYDLYTGTGTIANYVAKDASKVIGIEYIESAISDARINSGINNISNTVFVSGDLAATLNDAFVIKHGKPSVIITDPPRSGMHPDVVKQILKIHPEKIVYISCNPATQARDAAMMKEAYHIPLIQPVDMFPHTQHVENIMLLERK